MIIICDVVIIFVLVIIAFRQLFVKRNYEIGEFIYMVYNAIYRIYRII